MTNELDKITLLGLDIGTTNCKLIAYTPDGNVLAEATAGYCVRNPQPGFAELDPDDIMKAVTNLFRKIAPAIADCSNLSMAISAQGEAFILVDSDGVALSAAPISVDMRGRDLVATFGARTEVRDAGRAAGQTLNALTSLSKLLWFKDAEAETLAQAAQVLCVGEYVMRQLGVSPAMDYSMASRMGLLDNIKLHWSQELISLAELPAAIFPPVVPSGTMVGTVSIDVARRFGLNHAIEVYAGGHDQVCAMLGAGVVEAGTGLYSIGTTEAIALTMDGFQADLISQNSSPYPHVITGKYVELTGNQSGGRLLDWFRDLRGCDQTGALFIDLPDLPSQVTVLPHFAGSGSMLADEESRGIITGLSFQTTPQEMAHAVLEGITLEQALALREKCERGFVIKRLRAVGGGSRSPQWMQIKADITGLPIDCMEYSDTACSGAAVLAGLGSGVLTSINDAVAKFARLGTTYRPRPEFTEIYQEKLDLYYEIYRGQTRLQTKQSALATKINALGSRMENIA